MAFTLLVLIIPCCLPGIEIEWGRKQTIISILVEGVLRGDKQNKYIKYVIDEYVGAKWEGSMGQEQIPSLL